MSQATKLCVSRPLSDGERELLAELEADAREGLEQEEGACPECNGSGIEGILPDDREVPCKWCDGTGKEVA